jgi:hypothetical protein
VEFIKKDTIIEEELEEFERELKMGRDCRYEYYILNKKYIFSFF